MAVHPTLAYGEGFADAFSGLVLTSQDPIYRDSAGSTILLRLDLEGDDASESPPLSPSPPVPYTQKAFGITSEESTYTLIYNLAHGGPSGLSGKVIPNGNGGSVQIGSTPILKAAQAYASDAKNYVYIGTLLQQLVVSQLLLPSNAPTVNAANGGQGIPFDSVTSSWSDLYPPVLNTGNTTTTTVSCNALSTTTPAEDPNLGLDASRRFFRLELGNPTSVTFTLTSTAGVLLYVLDTSNHIEQSGSTEMAVAASAAGLSVTGTLVAGTHILVVTGIVPDILVDRKGTKTTTATTGVSSFTLKLQ